MRFGTWPRPRVEVIVRCFRSELGDEVVGGLAETTEGRERDGLEVDVKLFESKHRTQAFPRAPRAWVATTDAGRAQGVPTRAAADPRHAPPGP